MYGTHGNATSYLFENRSFSRSRGIAPPRPFTARSGRPFYLQQVVPPPRGLTIPLAFDFIMAYTQPS